MRKLRIITEHKRGKKGVSLSVGILISQKIPITSKVGVNPLHLSARVCADTSMSLPARRRIRESIYSVVHWYA